MAILFSEDFGGGTLGASVTTNNTVYTSVDNSVGAVPGTFDTDAYLAGLQSMRVTTSAQTSSHTVLHTPSGGWRAFGLKIVSVDTTPTALCNWYSGTTKGGDFRLMADRALQIRDGSSNIWTSSPVSLNAWHWIALKVNPNSSTGHRLKIYRDGAIIAGGDSGDRPATVVASAWDQIRMGAISNSTMQVKFARLRADTTTEPGSGITPTTAAVEYTQTDVYRVVVDTAGSTGTMTLTQTSGPTATITGPSSGKFTVDLPISFSEPASFNLVATSGAATNTKSITVNPLAGPSGGLVKVHDGLTWI